MSVRVTERGSMNFNDGSLPTWGIFIVLLLALIFGWNVG
jgi:hypothetical protein